MNDTANADEDVRHTMLGALCLLLDAPSASLAAAALACIADLLPAAPAAKPRYSQVLYESLPRIVAAHQRSEVAEAVQQLPWAA